MSQTKDYTLPNPTMKRLDGGIEEYYENQRRKKMVKKEGKERKRKRKGKERKGSK